MYVHAGRQLDAAVLRVKKPHPVSAAGFVQVVRLRDKGGSPPFEFGCRRVDCFASVKAEGQVVEPGPAGRMQAENVVLG